MPKIGGIGLPAKEFKAIVVEVTEEAIEARQAAHETVMEVMSERVTGDEARALLAMLNSEEWAQLMAKDPDQAREAIRELREEQQ